MEKAVEELTRGKLVAFPTETVYGLGADAASAGALDLLYQTKGRPRNHPVIVHLGAPDWLEKWARSNDWAEALMEAFWPGPLTLILKRAQGVSDQLTGGQDSVGVRMPSHPLALELLNQFGGGLAAPSANRFGRISPTTADHVEQEFEGRVAVLDGGACPVGVESTIVDVSGEVPVLLRPGDITPSQISQVLGRPVAVGGGAVRAPGTLDSHYAPVTPAFLVPSERLAEVLSQVKANRTGLLSAQPQPIDLFWLQAEAEPREYARALYSNLRLLDGAGLQEILIEAPPQGEAWTAVSDRLARATQGFKELK